MPTDFNKLLTIITVTRNDQVGLEQTYLSLKMQQLDINDWGNVEWIIIDGASKDNTCHFASKIELEGEFTFQSEADYGIFDAMNKGINLAKGKYLLFLNAGDKLKGDDTLKEILKLIDLSLTDLVAGRVEMYWRERSYISDLSPWVCHQSVLIPKLILDKYKFDSNKKFFGDLHLWMRLKRDGFFNVKRIELIISDFGMGGVGNKPETLWARYKERRQLLIDFNVGGRNILDFLYCCFLIVVWKTLGLNIYYKTLFMIDNFKKILPSTSFKVKK